ncbi:Uncharacterized protein AB751O23_AG_00020 [Chlamydiales bacterium SCGC AB-751-O23]|nr:Uncharacterized protein AB751O23_AG_00020 [Chlamydiales bacterium SCGC AB-751-O23]
MDALELNSPQNPKVKNLMSLRKKRERDRSQEFLIEGYRELQRATESGCKLLDIYFCEELFLGANEQALIQTFVDKGAQLFKVSKQIFEKISYRDRPDGLLGKAKQWKSSLEEIKKLLSLKNSLIIVAVSIEKPGNLGTILRSSDACGADAVLVCDECTDIFNPNVVRASTGTLFTQKVLECSSDQLISLFTEHDIQVIAATPGGTALYTEVDLKKSTAIVMGCEQYGLPDQWLRSADKQVVIPMKGQADSLNVAMATTILSYEALRQRSTREGA